jgi:DNA-directed RNA polymerase II subunit RPB1
MNIHKELEYNTKNIDIVKGVQFGILGPEEIIKRSAVEITTQETFVGNEEVINGLFDPRMGVIDNDKICKTCEQRNNFCPGHIGHLKLAKPVFYYHFIPQILKILRCICFRCSKLLVDTSNPEVKELSKKKSGKARWIGISNLCSKIKVCGSHSSNGCGCVQPDKYSKEGLNKIYAHVDSKSEDSETDSKVVSMNAEMIHKIFTRISDEDCDLMGYSRHWCRPDWMICSVMPVCPPCVRPSVRQDNNQRMEDDITHKLIDIIKTNKTILSKLNTGNGQTANPQVIEEWLSLLQYHVATLIDNEIPGVAPACQRSGRPLKSIRQRLKSKEGRIRGNLMGKRVDYSARSVITPDPGIGIDELGVPIKIAINLTYPEKVTKYNKERLERVVKNGPYKHPGAKSVKKEETGMTISLKHIDVSNLSLNEGDIVNRHIMDGDVVLFNRQPSLHKMSMMAHKIRVMKGSTFRLNVSVTPPYNADFDGDEMNMHVPQSIASRTELLNLAYVPYQIISPRENKPVISIVQDTLLGVNRLTRENVTMSVQESMNILCWNDNYGKDIIKTELGSRITGFEIFSSILPNINLMMGNKQYDKDKDPQGLSNDLVTIKKGILEKGLLDKDIFSKTSRGIVHTIYNDLGHNEARLFLNNVQFLINQYLLNTGFSVGISDLIADSKTNDKMREEINKQKDQVDKVISRIHLNVFENLSNNTNNDEFETRVNRILNQATEKVGKVGRDSLSQNNRMTNMVKSGSKGNAINIAQMVSCLGQQNVDGKRIPYGFTDRTLPHYTKYNDGAESRGFVENSFINGLKPQEFFFHAMGGREGLIDTAVKTSETGYIQRKLIKAMEDLKVSYDITVRNANDGIVQFQYGDDGVDAIHVESVMIGEICEPDFQKYKNNFTLELSELEDCLVEKEMEKLRKKTNVKKLNKMLQDNFVELSRQRRFMIEEVFNNNPNNAIYSPVALGRIINNAIIHFDVKNKAKTNLTPEVLLSKVDELKDKIHKIVKNENKVSNTIIQHMLSPKNIIYKKRITVEVLNYIIDNIYNRLMKAVVNPGEMVGAIAAQSIGEPATQMTLNTFHLAGVSSKSNVTRGVPRLKELLHISKNPKNPSLTVYLNKEISNVNNPKSKEHSQETMNQIELTTLRDIAVSSSIYYDPVSSDTSSLLMEEDKLLIDLYQEFMEINGEDGQHKDNSPWVLKINFDKRTMMNKKIYMQDVYFVIKSVYKEDISCIYSDDNSDDLIFRIRITQKSDKEQESDGIKLLKTLEKNIMNKLVLRGVEGIKKATMRRLDNQDGAFDDKNNFIQNSYWILDTDGNNLIETLSIENVDPNKTYSNDIYEMYELFGIEAARKTLMEELNSVLADSGAYVNYRHMSILVDIMTYKGYLMSIDRHGINRSDIGPLAKCSFEETTDQLLKAAMYGETDNMNGVSANIMLGQVAPCGTGLTEVLLDESKLINMMKETEESDEEEEEVANYQCDNLRIKFNFDKIIKFGRII